MANPNQNKPPRSSPGRQSIDETVPLNHAHEQMLRWLKKVRFRKSVFGGVSERDLWKKLGELNDLYDSAISAERARYDALLAAQQKSADATVAKYRNALNEARTKYNELVKLVQKMQKAGQETGNGEKKG